MIYSPRPSGPVAPVARRLQLVVVMTVVAEVALCASALADGNLNLQVARRVMLEEDSWDPLDRHDVLGVTVDFSFRKSSSLFHLLLGGSHSSDERAIVDSSTGSKLHLEGTITEVRAGFGARLTFPRIGFSSFVGPVLMRADKEIRALGESESISNTGLGLYMESGFVWRIATRVLVGVDLRFTHPMLGEDTGITKSVYQRDAIGNYIDIGLSLGWHWGRSP